MSALYVGQGSLWDSESRIWCEVIRMADVCVVCGCVGENMIYDEFLDGYVCSRCDTKREIGDMIYERRY